ncbi:hypothetical protein HJC99_01685 [Candidatus Saccharibacteria bacterium]|nr:hypothetical protein [Candidatus Saccharibacteria bacterium]
MTDPLDDWRFILASTEHVSVVLGTDRVTLTYSPARKILVVAIDSDSRNAVTVRVYSTFPSAKTPTEPIATGVVDNRMTRLTLPSDFGRRHIEHLKLVIGADEIE